ncbi:MAG TPA: 2'-5' RNA ligase family protein, partial [Polyangia bacterium]
MPKIRAFLAVNLSVPTIRAVAELQQTLRKEVPRELRVAWVNPANMHLTVKFLGAMEPEAAEAIADTLARRLAATP